MRLCLCLFLLITSNTFAQNDIQLPDEVKVKWGRIKKIAVNTECKTIEWLVFPNKDIDIVIFPEMKSIIISVDPDSQVEEFELRAIGAKGDLPLISNVCKIRPLEKPKPPIPPLPPKPLDPFQTKLKGMIQPLEYVIANKLSNFYLAAAEVVKTDTWPDTLTMTTSLKALAQKDIGTSLMPIRSEVNKYLIEKFGDESRTFDAGLRDTWAKELTYLSESLRRIAQ